jgi:hypothetical protein
MEKKFVVNCYSKWRFLLVLFFLMLFLALFMFFPLKFSKYGETIGVILIFLSLIPFFYTPKYFAKTILEITSDGINYNFEWIKPYWGFKLFPPVAFALSDVKTYKYEPSNQFHLFRIKLKSGQKIVLHQYEWDSKDDFQDFVDYFQRIVKNHNKKKSTIEPIKSEPLIMENKKFLIFLAIIISLIIIAAIVLISLKGINNPKGIIPILIILGPLFWVIQQIIVGLRKK